MANWLDVFNTRELALATWIIVIVTYTVISDKSRPALIHLIRTFFKRRIIGMQLVTWCYVGVTVWIFYKLNLWNSSMIKDTIIWTLFTTFLMIMRFMTSKKRQYLKNTFFEAFKIIVVFEFIVNMYTFNYFLELVILFALVMIVGMITVAEPKREYQLAVNFLNWILAIWGAFVIYHSLKQVCADFDSIEWSQTALNFLMPIWLTVLFIPFMFMLRKYADWELIRIRKQFSKKQSK